jgi:hypothetical protein
VSFPPVFCLFFYFGIMKIRENDPAWQSRIDSEPFNKLFRSQILKFTLVFMISRPEFTERFGKLLRFTQKKQRNASIFASQVLPRSRSSPTSRAPSVATARSAAMCTTYRLYRKPSEVWACIWAAVTYLPGDTRLPIRITGCARVEICSERSCSGHI